MADRKLYLGGRLRRLRRELGLIQSAMAAEIGVSPSYLNHLERNQRPVTAQVLLRLAEAYDVDLKSFAAEGAETPSQRASALTVDAGIRALKARIEWAERAAESAPTLAGRRARAGR